MKLDHLPLPRAATRIFISIHFIHVCGALRVKSDKMEYKAGTIRKKTEYSVYL